GCDTHRRDPLTDLGCTVYTAEYFARRMHELSHELCEGRWLATGGGGYDIWLTVPRAWTLVYGVVSHQDVPDEVPDAWRQRWRPWAPVDLPRRMREDPSSDAPPVVRVQNLETARRVARRVLEILGGRP
ncbi:MAG: acetoin utilization protein AcuC, partial [Firmicutes bacterium]|nr:acetoin utilization protein AcuC [Bacillota bacterium]